MNDCNRSIIVGLMGLDFSSGNLGCAALAYGFAEILGRVNRISSESEPIIRKVFIFSGIAKNELTTICNIIGAECFKVNLPRNLKYKEQISAFSNCDIIFDFTAGDSFSDIYGFTRFFRRSLTKVNAIRSKARFVLGSQTYGPFSNQLSVAIAKWIIMHSHQVYSRDKISADYIEKTTGKKAIQTLDVAFALPYKPMDNSTQKIKIGVNPSGLLWSGGYNRKNQFGLKVDYQKYCIGLIQSLCNCSEYEVHLIPHVISENLDYPDNDLIPCKALNSQFTDTILAPSFTDPMQAKTYISQMDILTGARMHATIAAFSTEVATIPFAYSRKFKGVFDGFNYGYIIDGSSEDTASAVNKTLNFVFNATELKNKVLLCRQQTDDGLNFLIKEIYSLLIEL